MTDYHGGAGRCYSAIRRVEPPGKPERPPVSKPKLFGDNGAILENYLSVPYTDLVAFSLEAIKQQRNIIGSQVDNHILLF